MIRSRATRTCLLSIALALQALACAALGYAAQSTSDTDYGRTLFTGQATMQNGGPPCASCHSISGLGFPNGGAMGPDLTGIYQTMGPDGTKAALETLFFPTMMPIYEKRPLNQSEQHALEAFFAHAGTTPVGQTDTLVLAAAAVAGFLVLLGLTWLAWRGRLRGVRAPLVAGIRARGARP